MSCHTMTLGHDHDHIIKAFQIAKVVVLHMRQPRKYCEQLRVIAGLRDWHDLCQVLLGKSTLCLLDFLCYWDGEYGSRECKLGYMNSMTPAIEVW